MPAIMPGVTRLVVPVPVLAQVLRQYETPSHVIPILPIACPEVPHAIVIALDAESIPLVQSAQRGAARRIPDRYVGGVTDTSNIFRMCPITIWFGCPVVGPHLFCDFIENGILQVHLHASREKKTRRQRDCGQELVMSHFVNPSLLVVTR
jgi:hypothetical protein